MLWGSSMGVMRLTPLCSDSCGSKSSRQCLIALCTGIGVRPPIAHSEPLVIVSHRSSSSTRLAATSRPAMIRSMVSTPRVEPTRHGVHLPHDSIEQNSIAKRAILAMSTVSSKTTMPPWPSIAPDSASAS